MRLWNIWISLVNQLRTSCSRESTFFWMVLILIGFTIKFDYCGVTSLARGVGLIPNYYTCMLNFFNSSAVDLNKLLSLWVELIFSKFDGIVKINGRFLIIPDGIKVGKEGKKMPGVKWLHQDSDSNSKAEFIMGHSLQAIAILVKGLKNYFAVPLTARIHEGFRFDCKDKSTLLDKLCDLLMELKLPGAFYLIADKYYCSGRLIKKLIAQNIHLITMMKKNAVAYYPVEGKRKGRGRRKKYGNAIKLFSLFQTDLEFIKASMPNNTGIMLEYCVVELLWKPVGSVVKFILVKHPVRGHSIILSTDLTLNPLDAILCYSLRFKIEVLFKQAVHQIGTFMYRFWLKVMKPRKRGDASGDWNLHFASPKFKERVAKKLRVYHLFIQLGFIAQGLMQYLSIYCYKKIWKNFGSWIRTIRDETLPSEKVVALSLTKTYNQFLIDETEYGIFKKFVRRRTAIDQIIDDIEEEKLAA